MASYNKSTIRESLTSLLQGYSKDEDRLTNLYKTALDNAEKTQKDALKTLKTDYIADRNRASADVIRDEKNAMTLLSDRGLGFSGEAAQTALNANVLMSNRLGALEREHQKNKNELQSDFADKKHDIALDYFDKTSLLNDKKTQLNLDVLKIEQNEKQNEADRLFKAEQQKQQQEYEKQKAEAERIWQEKQNEAERIWQEKQKEADRIADAAEKEKQLEWEREKLNAQLKAEYDQLVKKLQAEKDMQSAELYAKYHNIVNGGSGTSNGGYGGSYGNGSDQTLQDILNGFAPEISPKDLAKLMVSNATDDNFIEGAKSEYLINKYLLDMNDNYNMNDEYLEELIFMLKAYGYKDVGIEGMQTQVISYDSQTYYEERFNSMYERMVLSGAGEVDARQGARMLARKEQLDYIRSKTNGLAQFLACCKSAGITDSQANEYALEYIWEAPDTEKTGSETQTNTNSEKPTVSRPSNIVNVLK